jgi:ATP-binding cassette, subfamily B (MDR/TAP), member 1
VEGSNICPINLNGGKASTAGNILTIFFTILITGYNFTQLMPSINKISEGRVAAARIFEILDRVPAITSPLDGIVPEEFKGEFRFFNVTFAYPKDKSRNILENLSMIIDVKNAAFVGESGCGKSTVFQLIMRFYDPDNGSIYLDGFDLKNINL